MKKPALLLAAIFTLLVFPAHAAMIINDDFDGSDLSSSWKISPAYGATGWDYQLADSNLTPTEIYRSTAGTILLSQSFSPIDDFIAEFKFSWEEPCIESLQSFGIRLLDSDNNLIAGIFNQDSWLNSLGYKTIRYGESAGLSRYGTLPLSGSATASMVRKDGIVSFYWDGILLTSLELLEYATTFQLAFGFNSSGYSEMGTMSVDYVTLESDPDLSATPEPGTMALLGSALGLGAWWHRRRKRRA